ncbi:Golgin subfamily A member 7/ERF4 family-domain-containing protein [Fusarium solani]|uniref:Ras modification protein ERF4 n=1 Tax=Fusarium solani TaxID=169388 RepID=A0A9P9RBI3_FUSSL|nr:Golgin subfamily A member 7/ERF4 family-domain-containing protein [Fusarium solani]KAH7272739.1 Golgin subfamily A member 7/ERF4 family-domain-containing protein [Fusarium solani]
MLASRASFSSSASLPRSSTSPPASFPTSDWLARRGLLLVSSSPLIIDDSSKTFACSCLQESSHGPDDDHHEDYEADDPAAAAAAAITTIPDSSPGFLGAAESILATTNHTHRIPPSASLSASAPAPLPRPRSRSREKDAAIPSQRGRLGGRADILLPTDPPLSRAPPSKPVPATVVDAPGNNPHFSSLEPPKPAYPGTGPASANLAADAAAAALHSQHAPRRPPTDRHQQPALRHSPFHPRQGTAPSTRRARRLSAVRLWNPTNSTPRPHTLRKRRPSTPPPPSVPLQHPTLDNVLPDPVGAGPSDYPLLTLPEQRQTRHSLSARASLQVDRTGSSDKRVSLPSSVRASYDETRSRRGVASAGESEPRPSKVPVEGDIVEDAPVKLDKGKGKAVMMPENDDPMPSFGKDLERGPDIMDPRISNVSAGDGIGSALSSTDSSIMGEEVEPDAAGEWGPQHPCYPHLNPHVPIDSPEYVNTRIIRIRRDWLIQGDLAPTFSNLYPEILDPAGLSEQEFRRIIEKLNGELIPAFNPYGVRNILDSLLGLVTGWIWDDLGLTGIKSRLNGLEKWIEQWNLDMEKAMGSEDGAMAPKLMPLRQTGYMTLDIQIPDPEIAPAPSTTNPGDSRTALPLDPIPAIMA